MNTLPRADMVIIPVEKFTKYALNPAKDLDKSVAFERALGYNSGNIEKLIENIQVNLAKFPAKHKGNKGFGDIYEVILDLVGENGKTAKVLTGWIDDDSTGDMRLTTVYVDK